MKNSEFKTLTIDYKNWGKYSMLTFERKMCCLGFAALKCGYTKDEIEEIGGPANLQDFSVANKWPSMFLSSNKKDTIFTRTLVDINDRYERTTPERMAALHKEFAKKGVALKFTNVPPTIEKKYKELKNLR